VQLSPRLPARSGPLQHVPDRQLNLSLHQARQKNASTSHRRLLGKGDRSLESSSEVAQSKPWWPPRLFQFFCDCFPLSPSSTHFLKTGRNLYARKGDRASVGKSRFGAQTQLGVGKILTDRKMRMVLLSSKKASQVRCPEPDASEGHLRRWKRAPFCRHYSVSHSFLPGRKNILVVVAASAAGK
jgi:hypothetical protein